MTLKYYLMAKVRISSKTRLLEEKYGWPKVDWFCLEIYDDLESAENALEEREAKPHMRNQYEYKIEVEDDLSELFGVIE